MSTTAHIIELRDPWAFALAARDRLDRDLRLRIRIISRPILGIRLVYARSEGLENEVVNQLRSWDSVRSIYLDRTHLHHEEGPANEPEPIRLEKEASLLVAQRQAYWLKVARLRRRLELLRRAVEAGDQRRQGASDE